MSMTRRELKALMVRKGVTAAQIARKHKCTDQNISQIVRGFGRSAEVERLIAKALGLSVDEIFPVIPDTAMQHAA